MNLIHQDPPFLPNVKKTDIRILAGEQQGLRNLGDIRLDVQFQHHKIHRIMEQADLKDAQNGDLFIRFDFVTEVGRQKYCLEYFENGFDQQNSGQSYNQDISPLQNWFKRPKKAGKLLLIDGSRKSKDDKRSRDNHDNNSRGKISLVYQFYKQYIDNSYDNAKMFFEEVVTSKFHPDIALTLQLKGKMQTIKKNRSIMKVDFLDLHISSQQFRAREVLHIMEKLKVFGEDQDKVKELIQSPVYNMIKASEEAQMVLRFSSPRKIMDLYYGGLAGDEPKETAKIKDSPDIIKGLFKEKVDFTLVRENQIAIKATMTYANEQVFLRILKSYKIFMDQLDL